jgi:hypothetical protein
MPPFLVSRKWKIDRARLKAPNLTAMTRQRKVKVRSVTIIEATKYKGLKNVVTGEVIFDLKDAR